MSRWLAGALLGLVIAAAAHAHLHMFFPASPSAKVGQEVVLTLQFGHPFEHQLFDCASPRHLHVVTPDGDKEKPEWKVRKIAVAGHKGKKVDAYEFRYTPKKRGDYVFVAQMPPFWDEEDQAWIEDFVKVVVHVQAQKGWHHVYLNNFEWEPLTRPYGLEPGMVFQARARIPPVGGGRGPWQGIAEVERYNTTPPAQLPAGVHITRTVRPTADGVVTTTLTDPGWWSLTATRSEGGARIRFNDKGKFGEHKRRCILWVHVDPKPAVK